MGLGMSSVILPESRFSGSMRSYDLLIISVGVVQTAIATDFMSVAEFPYCDVVQFFFVAVAAILRLHALDHGRIFGAAFLIANVTLASIESLAVIIERAGKCWQIHRRRFDVTI